MEIDAGQGFDGAEMLGYGLQLEQSHPSSRDAASPVYPRRCRDTLQQ
jgi:hypothetical protein